MFIYPFHLIICTFFQIAIAYQIHRGIVVLAKTVNLKRIHENLKATKVSLDAEDMRRLKELDRNLRFSRFFMLRKDQSVEDFWDEESDKAYVIGEPSAKKTKVEE